MTEENLARTIRAYWAERGYRVQVGPATVTLRRPAPSHDRVASSTYTAVRSDLVGGLPRGWQGARRAEAAPCGAA